MTDDSFWEELYKDIPIPLQPGEKTLPMMIEDIGRKIDHHTMTKQVDKWIEEGKLIFVGIRITNTGNIAKAYKKV
jgi:hypothetical protein